MRIAADTSASKYETAGMKRSLTGSATLGMWLKAPQQLQDDDEPSASDHSTPRNTPKSAQRNAAVTIHRCPEPECGRAFNRKYTLVEHMKTHTGERPHVCPVRTCGKRFSTSGNLSRHKRLHGFIQPLDCPVEGCNCTFPSDNKLEKHMKFHLGSPVHVCKIDYCGKTFSTMGNLNRHLKNHHSDHCSAMANSENDEAEGRFVDAREPSNKKQRGSASAGAVLKREHDSRVRIPSTLAAPLPANVDPVDVMASILSEEVEGKGEEAAESEDASSPDGRAKSRRTILDDIISFHVNHFGPC
ncbi:Zinc finger protein, partial [Globisporangium splendens]